MKVVSVSPVTSDYGSALVYETTKILDSTTLAALVSYQNGTLSFRQSTPQLGGLQRGDVLVVPPKASQIVPNGILRFVLDIRNEGSALLLDTRQAGLAEAFQELHFGQPPSATSSGGGLGPSSARSFHPYAGVTKTLLQGDYTPPDSPYSIGGDAKFSLGPLTYDANLWAYADIDWGGCNVSGNFPNYNVDCHGPRLSDAGLLFQADEHASVSLTGSAGSKLFFDKDNLLKDPLYNDAIVIIPGLVWIHVTVKLHGHAEGTLKQDINLGVDQQFHMTEGPYYDGSSWQWKNDVNSPTQVPIK